MASRRCGERVLSAAGLALLAWVGCGDSTGSGGAGGKQGGNSGGTTGTGGAGGAAAGGTLGTGAAGATGAGGAAGAAGAGGTGFINECAGSICVLGQQYCYTFIDARPDAGGVSSVCVTLPANCAAADGGPAACGCVTNQSQCQEYNSCSYLGGTLLEVMCMLGP
jgi:hypothetical protein